MNSELIIKRLRGRNRILRRETASWQRAAVGMLALSLAGNMALSSLFWSNHNRQQAEIDRCRQQLWQAEIIRDEAVQALGALRLEVDRQRAAREEQAAAFEAVGSWEYVGECTITAYCPCSECCGQWADGLTATGIPATPGIVAVDPVVIPLGSIIIIDGQKYLAADTGFGVKGLHVDICTSDHTQAKAAGVRTADVWVEAGRTNR